MSVRRKNGWKRWFPPRWYHNGGLIFEYRCPLWRPLNGYRCARARPLWCRAYRGCNRITSAADEVTDTCYGCIINGYTVVHGISSGNRDKGRFASLRVSALRKCYPIFSLFRLNLPSWYFTQFFFFSQRNFVNFNLSSALLLIFYNYRKCNFERDFAWLGIIHRH